DCDEGKSAEGESDCSSRRAHPERREREELTNRSERRTLRPVGLFSRSKRRHIVAFKSRRSNRAERLMTPFTYALAHVAERSQLLAASRTVLRVSLEISRFRLVRFAVKVSDQIFGASANVCTLSHHLIPRLFHHRATSDAMLFSRI